jgi:hypothetical protein
MTKFRFVALTLALTAAVAGCASTSTRETSYYPDTSAYPSASPVWSMSPPSPDSPVLVSPNTDAPLMQHSDAAGSASVPGYYSVPPAVVVTPDSTR